MELQLQKLLRSNAPLPASASLLFFHILPHPEKVHFSTTVFGIFALFLFGFYFCVPVSVFDFPSLRLAHVQQKYSTCHSFFSMYVYTGMHTCRRTYVCVCVELHSVGAKSCTLYAHFVCVAKANRVPAAVLCCLLFLNPPPPWVTQLKPLFGVLELRK